MWVLFFWKKEVSDLAIGGMPSTASDVSLGGKISARMSSMGVFEIVTYIAFFSNWSTGGYKMLGWDLGGRMVRPFPHFLVSAAASIALAIPSAEWRYYWIDRRRAEEARKEYLARRWFFWLLLCIIICASSCPQRRCKKFLSSYPMRSSSLVAPFTIRPARLLSDFAAHTTLSDEKTAHKHKQSRGCRCAHEAGRTAEFRIGIFRGYSRFRGPFLRVLNTPVTDLLVRQGKKWQISNILETFGLEIGTTWPKLNLEFYVGASSCLLLVADVPNSPMYCECKLMAFPRILFNLSLPRAILAA